MVVGLAINFVHLLGIVEKRAIGSRVCLPRYLSARRSVLAELAVL